MLDDGRVREFVQDAITSIPIYYIDDRYFAAKTLQVQVWRVYWHLSWKVEVTIKHNCTFAISICFRGVPAYTELGFMFQ